MFEQTTLADERHTTEEQGAPDAAEVESPLELAARMARRDAPSDLMQ
jgi:hypothetical protein